MIIHKLKVYPSKVKLSKKKQLAWKLAELASDNAKLNKDSVEMVINRIIDNASVAIASLNRKSVISSREMAMKHSMPIMQKQKAGSFIAVASTAGLVGFNGLCPYIASKHAVCGMVKTACLENGPMNIRVNALAPGPVDNRMMASLGEQLNPDDPASVVDMVNGMVATNRYSTNEEIANLALFLGSDESSNCSGSVYVCDGGFTAA